MTTAVSIEDQARLLAGHNRKNEPGIKQVFWFPDENEVRLVSLFDDMPVSDDDLLHPIYFRPAPEEGIFVPSGIALIRPSEFGSLKLPEGWGEWENAIEI